MHSYVMSDDLVNKLTIELALQHDRITELEDYLVKLKNVTPHKWLKEDIEELLGS